MYNVLRKSQIAFALKLLGATLSFLMTVIVSRKLGATQAGYYFLSFSIITIIASVGKVGLENTVLRFTATDHYARRSIIKKSLLIVIFVSGFLTIALYFFADIVVEIFDKEALLPCLKGMSLSVMGLSMTAILAHALQGSKYISWSIFLMNVGLPLCLLVVLTSGWASDAEALATWFSGMTLLLVMIAMTVFLTTTHEETRTECLSWRQIWLSCIPLSIVIFTNHITQYGGQVISGVYLDAASVAQLAVAQRTAMLASFVLMSVNMVVSPNLAELFHKNDMHEVERLVKYALKLTRLATLPVVFVVIFLADYIVLFFGDEYAASAMLLRILVLGQCVNVMTGPALYMLLMSGNENDVRNLSIVSCVFLVVVSLLLTSSFNVLGSAVAIALAVSIQNLAGVYLVHKRIGVNLLSLNGSLDS